MAEAPAVPRDSATALPAGTTHAGYCTIAQAAALLGLSRVTIWRWIREGRIPAVRLGHRTVRIKRADLERALTESVPPASAGAAGAAAPAASAGISSGAAVDRRGGPDGFPPGGTAPPAPPPAHHGTPWPAAYLAAIVESSVDAIKAKTLDGTVTFWNQATERMYGYTAEEALGRHISFVVPPERAGEMPEILARIARGERVEHYETERVRKDGTRLDVSISVSPVRDETGAIIGAATIARDITERKRAERGQRLLAAASRLFAEAQLDADAMLAGVARAAIETVADFSAVVLAAEDGATLRTAAVDDVDPELAQLRLALGRAHPPWVGEGIAGRIVERGEPVLVPVVAPEALRAEVLPAHRPYLERVGPRSLLGAPLRAYGRTLGALVVGRRVDGRPYAEQDLVFVRELAERAAMALHAARVYAGEQRARAAAERLATITQQVGASLAPQAVLDQIAGAAAQLLASAFAGVFLLEPGGDFALAAARGLDSAPGRAALRLPRGRSLAGRAVAERRTLVVEDAAGEPGSALPRLLSGEPIGSLVVAPIVAGGEALGAVEVYSPVPRAFPPEAAQPLTGLAAAAAAALVNARLYRDLQENAAAQAELNTALRKVAEARDQALAEAEAARGRLHELFEQAPAAISVLRGPDHVIEFVNRRGRELIGPRDVIGKGVREAFPELAGQGLFELLDRVYAGGEPVLAAEVPARWLKDGTEVEGYFSLVYQPVRGAGGRVEGVMSHAVEVTELVRSRQRIEALAAERDAFLAAASHDLKNPLATVKGAAQLLRRWSGRRGGVDPERLAAGLETIEATSNQMLGLIEELLDATRLRLGQPLVLDRRPTDLVALARRAAAAQQATTDRHAIRVECAAGALVGTWDAARIERVLGNLLANAVKYSPGGGEVAVEVAREDGAAGAADRGWAVVRVRDRGVGIPAEDRERIFGQFERGSNVGRIAGTGLGLAAARQIVALHGGTVHVESAVGSGSTFTVRLPLDAEGEAR